MNASTSQGIHIVQYERGSASVEFLGTVSLLIFVALTVLQGLVVVGASIAADNAARDIARSASNGSDPAIVASSYDNLVIEHVQDNGTHVHVEIELEVPVFLPWWPGDQGARGDAVFARSST